MYSYDDVSVFVTEVYGVQVNAVLQIILVETSQNIIGFSRICQQWRMRKMLLTDMFQNMSLITNFDICFFKIVIIT